ncbi:thioredoxin-like protein [Phanerochaete sordida]|uniref:Thioredoxin-like protein n=1 Tax=Phanerochaete sordida TaxID=48140 RepID=A0A9P3FXC3_9APHY|nr:thioredoxin-like protein [Phanerochaete sordida]
MALQPSLRPLIIVGSPDAPHTLDCFLDYVCSYSTKLGNAIENVLKPLFDPKGSGQYAGKVKIIFRNQVQPWHGTSILLHEAGLAMVRVAPEQFWPFSLAIWAHHKEYHDLPAADMTPRQVRHKITDLAVQFIGEGRRQAFLDLLTNSDTQPNYGVAVTNDLKYTVRFSRQNSVHVSPTVLFDGVAAPEISSSWGEKEWTEWLAKKVQ